MFALVHNPQIGSIDPARARPVIEKLHENVLGSADAAHVLADISDSAENVANVAPATSGGIWFM